MIQHSELVTLSLAVALAPLFHWAYLGIRLRSKRWLAVALCAMLGAYTATVLEGFVAEPFFNTIEHLLYAVAGVSFAIVGASLLEGRPRPEGGRT